jgi:hypothetical protein
MTYEDRADVLARAFVDTGNLADALRVHDSVVASQPSWASAKIAEFAARIERVLDAVADHHGRRQQWITNRSRGTAEHSDARHVSCWILRHSTSLSLAEIGSVIGGLDHSTVRHAIKRVESSAGLKETAARLLESVTASPRPGLIDAKGG